MSAGSLLSLGGGWEGDFSSHKHGLDDDVTMEGLEIVDNLTDIIVAYRAVNKADVVGIDGVELQDVVVNTHQGIVDLWAMSHRGIAEYADLCIRTVLVAQADGVVDNLGKVGVAGRLAIAGKGEYVGQLLVGNHLLQLLFQLLSYQLARRSGKGRAVVAIETALAVDAVETAHLAVGRLQVDAKRDAEATTMDRPEDGRWINDCTHSGCKSTKLLTIDH